MSVDMDVVGFMAAYLLCVLHSLERHSLDCAVHTANKVFYNLCSSRIKANHMSIIGLYT